MKKYLIILFAAGLSLSASAQHFGRGGVSHYYVRPRVTVGIGYYTPIYSPFWGYYGPWYGYPPVYGYYERPSKLAMQIEDIRNDYQDKIRSAKHDKSIPRNERKQKVHELKHERDEAILQAKRNYYKY